MATILRMAKLQIVEEISVHMQAVKGLTSLIQSLIGGFTFYQ